jgi:hypothetical protein
MRKVPPIVLDVALLVDDRAAIETAVHLACLLLVLVAIRTNRTLRLPVGGRVGCAVLRTPDARLLGLELGDVAAIRAVVSAVALEPLITQRRKKMATAVMCGR